MSILNLYDKYECDFGLLYERWASEKDRRKVTREQARTLEEYVEKLYFIKVEAISAELKDIALKRIDEIEEVMADEVVKILRRRILDN